MMSAQWFQRKRSSKNWPKIHNYQLFQLKKGGTLILTILVKVQPRNIHINLKQIPAAAYEKSNM